MVSKEGELEDVSNVIELDGMVTVEVLVIVDLGLLVCGDELGMSQTESLQDSIVMIRVEVRCNQVVN